MSSLPDNFVEALEAFDIQELLAKFQTSDRPEYKTFWHLPDKIKPIDLYCYLYAKFGPPNGIQNLFRKDTSDNLVHWEWTLRRDNQYVNFQGLNFRTEIWITEVSYGEDDKPKLVDQFHKAFCATGHAMGQVRGSLEHWVEFVNPYTRIRKSVDALLKELEQLDINYERDRLPEFRACKDQKKLIKSWQKQTKRYSKAFGLCFGIRSMLPVMAEAFINLIFYMLMKPDIKKDDRLMEGIIRQPIDIKIRSLSHNCVGFAQNIDYSHDSCKNYHRLVNDRNDLLHGNVALDKLQFNELYFNRTVPIFTRHQTMWDRAFLVDQKAAGLDCVHTELSIINAFIEYILSCINENDRETIKMIIEKPELGYRTDKKRIGSLFADFLVDFHCGPAE